MDLPDEIEDYIKETIDDSLGLPVSTHTLHLKLRGTEDAHRRLRDQYLLLLDKLRLKEQLFDRAKAEANMSAVAVKKFVEENQRLAAECASLMSQCNKWEKECSLYERDREALMDFGNEADERAKVAEIKIRELEEELQFLKHQYQIQGGDPYAKSKDLEQSLLGSILMALVNKEETELGHANMEAIVNHKSCQELLKMGNLRPSTQRVLSLAGKVIRLQRDKENLRANLIKAEEEVKLLSEENNILDAEIKRLLKQKRQELNLDGSGGKHSNSGNTKGNKRKSSARMSSAVDMKMIDSKNADSLRQPLSPLRQNSPECRMHKK